MLDQLEDPRPVCTGFRAEDAWIRGAALADGIHLGGLVEACDEQDRIVDQSDHVREGVAEEP